MNRISKLLSGLIATVILFTVMVSAAGDAPYSMENDPLVSKSYVDQMRSQIVTELTRAIDSNSLGEHITPYTFEYAKLSKGQLVAAAGSCEIVLRSGSGVVVITSPANLANGVGFSDLTAGAEVLNGATAPNNHLLLASSGDGRMIEVTSDSAYFMIRGEYTIVD